MKSETKPRLDIDDMVGNMHFRMGGVFALFGRPVQSYTREHILELRDKLWELFPFLKALGRLALEHPERTRELWAEALVEPMPFGAEPIGLPKDEVAS